MLKNAQDLLNELETPSKCDPNDTLCVSETAAVRVRAAANGLRSLMRAYRGNEGIIATLEKHIGFQDKIIAKYEKIDTNSQRIDTLGTDSLALMREQHRDDKETIGDLQASLESCRSNQKWIFAGGALIGGWAGYKIRGAGQFQNPFVPQSTSTFQLVETQAERMMRERLKVIKELNR